MSVQFIRRISLTLIVVAEEERGTKYNPQPLPLGYP